MIPEHHQQGTAVMAEHNAAITVIWFGIECLIGLSAMLLIAAGLCVKPAEDCNIQ